MRTYYSLLMIMVISNVLFYSLVANSAESIDRKKNYWINYVEQLCSQYDSYFDFSGKYEKCKSDFYGSKSAYNEFERDIWRWVNTDKQLWRNNCYQYATSTFANEKSKNTFIQPGMASGRKFEITRCENDNGQLGLSHAAQSDGLKKVSSPSLCSSEESVVALIVNEDHDFHWLVKRSNGLWMHKFGAEDPSWLDMSGKLISNPKEASFKNYDQFCGYYCVGIQVKLKNFVDIEETDDSYSDGYNAGK